MKHSTGNTLISSNHPGTFAIYSFASNALVILSDGHTCDGTFNVDMWTTWASRALNHVVSFSKRGGGSNLRLLVSQQHSHQASETNQATNSTTKPPHGFYTSKYIDRHHQQSFPNMRQTFTDNFYSQVDVPCWRRKSSILYIVCDLYLSFMQLYMLNMLN